MMECDKRINSNSLIAVKSGICHEEDRLDDHDGRDKERGDIFILIR